MASKRPRPNPLCDKRYHQFVGRYRHNWPLACKELFGRYPTDQQLEILDEVSQTGSMVSIASGHGTGKSDVLAAVAIIFITCYPDSRVVMVANKIQQLQIGLGKYMAIHWRTATQRFPWLRRYFEVKASGFRSKYAPLNWGLALKGFKAGTEESLAGEHAKHLIYIVDEASSISERAFTIMTGALTEEDNRITLISQPTRNSGYFFDSHHSLAKVPGNPTGIYVPIVLNSELSPLVTPKWIKMKARELGGTRSEDYNIKVRGVFPNQAGGGILLSRGECEDGQKRRVMLPPGWGWVATADVGDGSDKSVLIISRVWGYGHERRVVPVKVWITDHRALAFARFIHATVDERLYPNITIGVDGGGVGSPCCDALEELGRVVERIHWGRPCFGHDDQRRYVNERAQACFQLRDAVISGRCRLPGGKLIIDQASRIPVFVNEKGQHQVMGKKEMRKQGLKSPDVFDAMAYSQLTNYTPAERHDAERSASEKERLQAAIDAEFAEDEE